MCVCAASPFLCCDDWKPDETEANWCTSKTILVCVFPSSRHKISLQIYLDRVAYVTQNARTQAECRFASFMSVGWSILVSTKNPFDVSMRLILVQNVPFESAGDSDVWISKSFELYFLSIAIGQFPLQLWCRFFMFFLVEATSNWRRDRQHMRAGTEI